MPVPSLPLDVWFRISSHLAPAELSSLSQVSKELYRVATDEEHFQRHVSVPENKFKHPAHLYRRERALFYPPDNFISTPMSSCISMLCVSNTNLLFVDISRSRLIVSPSGLNISVNRIIGKAGNPFFLGLYYAHMSKNTVVLPEDHVAFMTGTNHTRLTILNVENGLTRTYFIGKRDSRYPIVDGKSVVAAGKKAAYLMYHYDRNTIVLFDWRKGSISKKIRNFRNNYRGRMIAYMTGECPCIGGMTVLGYVIERPSREDATRKYIFGIGFDGFVEAFRVDNQLVIARMLKSVDMKTSILVTSTGHPDYKITGFLGRKKHEGSNKTDYSDTLSMETCPELQDNGRVLIAKHEPLVILRSRIRDSNKTRLQLTAVLEDSGIVRRTSILNLTGTDLPVWSRRTCRGLLVLLACSINGWIELVNLVEDGNHSYEIRLKKWYIHDLDNMVVVEDHLIFATSLDGKFHVLHFDRFCNGGQGVYACCLLSQNRSHDTGTSLPTRKRQRTS